MSILKDRIRVVRDEVFKGSQDDFAKALNWTDSRVKDLERGKVKELKGSEALDLEEKFLVNGWWALTGRGSMIDGSTNGYEVKVFDNINSAAGHGAQNGDESYNVVRMDGLWLRSSFGIDKFLNLEVIGVIGESMEPFVHSGEKVMLQRTNEVKNNQIIIARLGDNIFIKRYSYDPFNNIVKLASENLSFGDMEITKDQFDTMEIIGVVLGTFKPY